MDERVTEALAKFACSVGYDMLPKEVVAKAKQCILDQLGVQIACSTLPWAQVVYDYARSIGAQGTSTIVNYGLKTHEEYAALTNGTFGQSFEIDDGISKGQVGHPGCSTIPAALALGESQGIGGKELLAAVVVGYEVMAAVARGVQPSSLLERGFHPNGTLGPFAAAAVASAIMGLDEEKMINALGIAGSHACGLMEYTQSGSDVKRLYGGLGAMGGIRSAFLAKRGYTGPRTVLEGKKGFCQAFSNHPDPGAMTQGLGQDYRILLAGFKPYCCNGMIIPGVDAVLNILRQNTVAPEEIEQIQVGTNQVGMIAATNIGPEPRSLIEAQISMHFSLAMTVVKGKNDFRTYTGIDLKDAEVVSVARKVKVYLDEQSDRDLMVDGKRGCRVTIETKNGRSYHSYSYSKGWPDNPFSQEELEEKFIGLATVVLRPDRADEIIVSVRNLEQLDNVSSLTRLLVS